MTNSPDIFDADVPPPLFKFDPSYERIHPDNLELLRGVGDDKIFTDKTLKAALERLKKIKRALKARGVPALLDQKEELEKRSHDLRVRRHLLRKDIEDGVTQDHSQELAQIKQLEKECAELTKQIRFLESNLKGSDDLQLHQVIREETSRFAEARARRKAEITRLKKQIKEAPTTVQEAQQQLSQVIEEDLHNANLLLQISKQIEPHKPLLDAHHRVTDRIQQHSDALQDQITRTNLVGGLKKEAQYIAGQIIYTWVRLGYVQIVHTGQKNWMGKEIVKKRYPSFSKVVITEDMLQFKVDVSSMGVLEGTKDHLPAGVSVWDLIKEDTLRELSIAVERQVTSPHVSDEKADFINGCWVYVHRLGLVDGLPKYVSYRRCMSVYRPSERDKMPMPLGVKAGRTVNWVNLTEQPHILVAGQTNSGKTNLIHVMLATLITEHQPDEIRLVLIDLKEGASLKPYESIPHSTGEVITSEKEVAKVMTQLEKLRRQRMYEIGQVADNISSYNILVPEERRMPRILIVFDEYGALNAYPEEARQVERMATQLAMKARAAGIHLLVGAQSPHNSSVPRHIKDNVTVVFSGRQRTLGASMTTLGGGKAKTLPKIQGRMFCELGTDLFQVQIPHITDMDIASAIEAAMVKPTPQPLDLPELPEDVNFEEVVASMQAQAKPQVTEEDVIRVAIEEREGRLSAEPIWETLSSTATRQAVRDLVATISAREHVTLRDTAYEVVKERNAYRLVQLANSPTRQAQNIPDSWQVDGGLGGELNTNGGDRYINVTSNGHSNDLEPADPELINELEEVMQQ